MQQETDCHIKLRVVADSRWNPCVEVTAVLWHLSSCLMLSSMSSFFLKSITLKHELVWDSKCAGAAIFAELLITICM